MYTPKRRATSSRTDNSPLIRKSISSPFHSFNITTTNEKESPFNKSSAFQVIKQNEEYEIQSYGNVLPVEVTKVLSVAESITCNIDNNGWAMVVANKKLYAWKYTIAFIKKMVSCFILQLPSTELSHSACLTCILQNEETSGTVNTRTSVINISPEGDIRYWPNIARSSTANDVRIDLKGKQCHRLLPLMPHGCIMITTTKELFLLTPTQTSVICQELSGTNGMFSGISRRVSSFWTPAEAPIKHTPCLCDGTLDYLQSERYFFIGDKVNIQKWQTSGPKVSDSKMLYELNLLKLMKISTNNRLEHCNEDNMQVIDIKSAGFGTLVLMALWKDDTCYDCYIVLLKFQSQEASSIESLRCIDYDFENTAIDDIHIELPTGSYQAYIYTPNVILSLSVLGQGGEVMSIPFTDVNNSILGAGHHGSDSIFLNKKHGLISVKINQVQQSFLDESFANLIKRSNQTQINHENESNLIDESINEPSNVTTSSFLRLAFLQYSKNKKVVNSLQEYLLKNINNVVELLNDVSEEIINSTPASDSTWANSNQLSLQSSSSLLINQLNDKMQTYKVFQTFLEQHNIFDIVSNSKNKLHSIICEHGEKLQVCMTLLQMFPDYEELLNNIINGDLDESSVDKVHDKDKIFTQVANIGHMFSLLVSYQSDALKEMNSMKEQIELISSVSTIFLNCFRSSWEYRQNYYGRYELSENITVPWTGSSYGDNNREILKVQIGIILKQALPHVDSVKSGTLLCQCVIVLADVLLDGFQRELCLQSSTSSADQYTYDSVNEDFYYQRENICHTLVNLNYNEPALTLAEKYEDFSLMIKICEKTNQPEKIEEYKVLFQNQGFNDVLYSYYMEKGAWGKLMSLNNASTDYENFLRNHHNLSWIHFLGSKEFSKASQVLKTLSQNEEFEVERKKVMLILSNLSMLASSQPPNIIESSVAESDRALEIIEYQTVIMKALQREENTPLKAEEILEICIADDENIHDDKFYLQLLELLLYVETDVEALQTAIWRKILDADRWDEQSMIDYSTVLKQRVIFKCLQYISQRDSLKIMTTSLKDLISSDESGISDTCRTQVKACWELLQMDDSMMIA